MNLVLGGLVWCRSCLHWLADKDSLLVAMGSLAYKVKGTDFLESSMRRYTRKYVNCTVPSQPILLMLMQKSRVS
jgi:hypothetical protein